MPLLLFSGPASPPVDLSGIATRFGLSGGIGRPLDSSLFANKEPGVIIPDDPIPSGNKRVLGFTNRNRSITNKGQNRVLSLTGTNRKLK